MVTVLLGVLAIAFFGLALLRPDLMAKLQDKWTGQRYTEKEVRLGAVFFLVSVAVMMWFANK